MNNKAQVFPAGKSSAKGNTKYAIVSLIFACILAAGCSTTPTPKGAFYTNTRGPLFGTSNEEYSKSGKSSVVCILGIVASGDASIDNIASKNDIKKIHHVDYEDFSVLFGAYQKYTVYVYGE